MSKWEYLVEEIDASCQHPKSQTMELNWKGEEGWELVNIIHVENREYAYFKRPLRFKNVYSITTNTITEDTKKDFDILKALG